MRPLKRSLLVNLALAAAITFLFLFLNHQGLLNRLELAALDFSFRLRGPVKYNPHVVIVEISDSDILEIGRWPWKRSWHAALTKALKDFGVQEIYFDIIFSEASNTEDDSLLSEAIKLSKNVYLPFVFQDTTYDIQNALWPIKSFADYIKGSGSINIYPDPDGTLRRIPLFFSAKDGIHPHAALKLAMDYAGLKIKEIKPDSLLLSSGKEEVKIPLVDKNKMLVNWSGKWKNTFKHYSFLEVLNGYNALRENKKSEINLTPFKNSICLVAVTAIGLYDIKPTPLEPEYPGIGIIANAISNILERDFLTVIPQWLDNLLIVLLTLIPAFFIFGERPFRESIVVFSLGIIYFLASFLFFKKGIALDFSTPLLGLFSSYLTVETYNTVCISIERKTFFKLSVTDGLTGLYNIRYFKMLLETEIVMTRTDASKKFALVMSDVDHFKHFNDTYGHPVGDLVLKEVANVLKNAVRSSDIVARYGGEEMIALLRGSSLKDALQVAEKLRRAIENAQVKDEKNTYQVTASLGVATYKITDNVETIVKRVDDGLYKAKESGRNRVSTVEE